MSTCKKEMSFEMLPSNNSVDSWIYQVGLSHSGSLATEKRYRLDLGRFCSSVKKTAEEIIEDYDKLPEKVFKRFYASAIVTYLAGLDNSNRSSGSISTALNSIRSFFKYNSLPLNFIPSVRVEIENHNRDLTGKEINQILRNANFRERAFFTLIAQTGLRPSTLTKLKIRDFENILSDQTPVPCLIKIEKNSTKGKYHDYFTFASKESIDYLKEYLKTRKQELSQNSYVFVMFDDEDKPASPGVFTHLFRRIVLSLQEQNIIDFKTNRKEMSIRNKDDSILRTCVTRNELRLYNLRKFFRKFAGQAGSDFVNFWMGHASSLGVDLHYFSRDVEYHRKIYKEKAMPHLRLLSRTPSETEKSIEELKTQLSLVTDKLLEKDKEIELLKEQVVPISKLLEKLTSKYGVGELVLSKKSTGELDTKWNALIEVPSESEEGKVKKKSEAKKLQE